MNENDITQRDLAHIECIGTVSSYQEGRLSWTRLSLFYRPGYRRAIVGTVEGFAIDDPTSHANGIETPRSTVFKYIPAGTIERALRWFDDSDLARSLAHQVAGWQEERASMTTTISCTTDSGCASVTTTMTAPPPPAREVGYRGAPTVTDALLWLYPEDELAGSLLGRPMRLERDFGVPARTVRHALSQEEGTALADLRHGPWVAPWLAALRHFDRAAWIAARATDREPADA